MNQRMRKLAAYLHDPPQKAYDFGPHHLERGQHHAANLGVAELWESITGQPDWSAAAADRFVFPGGCARLLDWLESLDSELEQQRAKERI